MENVSEDIIAVLRYLIPGFLAAWVFYGLTSHPKPSQFERVVQALIFTLMIEFSISLTQKLYGLFTSYFSLGKWDETYNTIYSTIGAILLGFAASILANNDYLHGVLRRIGVTSQTSYPSEWFGIFNKKSAYVVLQLKDDRRVYGWPRDWPSDPNQGHFALEQASWQNDGEEIKLVSVDTLLIDVKDVRWVEFMEPTQE